MLARLLVLLLLLSSSTAFAQDAQPPKHLRIRVSEGVLRKLVVKEVTPLYPENAHGTGMVILHLLVDEDGVPITVEFDSGDSAFTDAAIEAAKQWRFRPYAIDDKKIQVDSRLTFVFSPSE